MQTILFAVALTLAAGAACSRDTAPQRPQPPPASDPIPTTANNDDIGDLPADPTLPSWAPRECAAYHAAIVKLAECDAVPQQSRNVAKTQYDVDNARWEGLHEQPPEELQTVRESCRASYHAVRGQNTCLVRNQDRTSASR